MTAGLIDISVSLRTDLPVWPGDPLVRLEPVSRIADGAGANVTGLGIGTHTGTHIDAPWHFIDDGKRLEAVALNRLIGPCYVADLTDATDHLTPADLEAADIPTGTTRLLLRTRNSDLWRSSPSRFVESYLGISIKGARWLIDQRIDLVGLDYHSVEPFDSAGDTHRTMLGAKQVILETINLGHVEPGHYTLYCLPLRIDGYDGAPCRAVLEPIR